MKKYVTVCALMALPACFGVGNGVDLTPTRPVEDVTSQAQASLDGLRAANLASLQFDSRVGLIVQNHANDMFNRNYLSIFEAGSDVGGGVERDLGDDLNDAGLPWDEIVQMVAQGDLAVSEVMTGFATTGSAAGSQGSNQVDLANALASEDYELFGLGKAGTGADVRWALLLVDPQ
ncbi:MAG: hypothetical protein NWQ23_00465 [Yoonia sp.]|uniref:hypothetical protein n=1 Tax=Yoonia sp. TaxID=2212373 RepID=UPI00273D019E|nr:hypothetical protein [Yoonia sp.]MDP5083859.1 hypothetical protein [Yoonia sp.]